MTLPIDWLRKVLARRARHHYRRGLYLAYLGAELGRLASKHLDMAERLSDMLWDDIEAGP
jgi:hypothetical protein